MRTLIRRHGRHLLYTMLVAMLVSCGNESKQNIEQPKSNTETYKTKAGYIDIEIVKVRDCEYVLWHNSYEHYEGCNNPKHCN